MGASKIKTHEDFLEKFNEIAKPLSFNNDSDIIVLTVNVKDFTPVSLKAMATCVEDITKHKCIIVPDKVHVSSNTKEQTLQRMKDMIRAIEEIQDNSSTEISW